MKVSIFILGILLLAGASVLTYLLYDHNKSDPDPTQIVLYSIIILIAIILSVLCFINSVSKKSKYQKSKYQKSGKKSKFRV